MNNKVIANIILAVMWLIVGMLWYCDGRGLGAIVLGIFAAVIYLIISICYYKKSKKER